MIDKESYLWVERYNPKTVDECILPKRIKNTLNEFVESGEIKSYTAVGSAGCGKTSSAKALLSQLDIQYLFINASVEGNIDTVRNKIVKFASRKTIGEAGSYKVIVLDECDYLTHNAQAALRGIIEEFSANCRFILTANYENKIMDALRSRCPVVDFNFNKAEKREMMQQFLPRASEILAENNVTFDKDDLINFCVARFPDFRKTLSLLQRNSIGGTLELNYIGSNDDERVAELINNIVNCDFDKMRKWVAENLDNDGHVVRRALYESMIKKMNPESIPALILILNNFDASEVQCKDLEIHMVAMCVTIMQECEFK